MSGAGSISSIELRRGAASTAFADIVRKGNITVVLCLEFGLR